MSLSRQTLKRLPTIKLGFRTGHTYEEIATLCKVHHRTIERDVRAWVESGLFETWIKEEFIRLHPKVVKEDIVKAYDNITKLVGKMLTRKAEIKTTEEIKIEEKRVEIVGTLAEYESIIERALDRNLQENHPRKQVDTRQSQAATT